MRGGLVVVGGGGGRTADDGQRAACQCEHLTQQPSRGFEQRPTAQAACTAAPACVLNPPSRHPKPIIDHEAHASGSLMGIKYPEQTAIK